MKRVVSVSLGSSRRDHSVQLELRGQVFQVERVGTDGDLGAMVRLIRELDGKVAAFGLGGMDIYIFAGDRRYILREGQKVARAARVSPVVDGSGLKNTLERSVISYLGENTGLLGPSTRVLMVCAMDRFGMAQALFQAGCQVVMGDLAFVLGLPARVKSLRTLEVAAGLLVPLVRHLPLKYLYPTGSRQEESRPRFSSFFQEADIIAGDFHFIRRNMPPRLGGKSIITNTVTGEDVKLLKGCGVEYLVTTTPEIQGRSFGTNVMEALLLALGGKDRELSPEEYRDLLGEIDFRPRVERLN